jgi:tRNA-modifying protein YgfZ
MTTALLTDRGVIALCGAEARDFLQGLITNEMAECMAGNALYAALLTPQGKILFEFFVVADGERLLLECAAVRSEELTKRLGFYRLRAKVDITPQPDMAVAALWEENVPETSGITFSDPRLAALGLRMIAPRSAFKDVNATLADYHAHRISLGVPDSADLAPDTVFALDAGLEELNGVSFKKGCYIGQEVTARMKHRSTARRRILIVEAKAALPAPGTAVIAGERELGNLMTGQGNRALALVRLDRLAEAESAHASITAGQAIVTLHRPGWLRI